MYIAAPGGVLAPSKLMISIILNPFWVYALCGYILRSIVSKSHFWKRPGARDMIFFGSHVGPHIPNIGIWRYMADQLHKL